MCSTWNWTSYQGTWGEVNSLSGLWPGSWDGPPHKSRNPVSVQLTFAAGLWIQHSASPCNSLMLSVTPCCLPQQNIPTLWVSSQTMALYCKKRKDKTPVSMQMEVVMWRALQREFCLSRGWAKNSNCLIWYCLYYTAFLFFPTGLSILHATPKPKSSLTACLCPTATLCTCVLQVLQVSVCNSNNRGQCVAGAENVPLIWAGICQNPGVC